MSDDLEHLKEHSRKLEDFMKAIHGGLAAASLAVILEMYGSGGIKPSSNVLALTAFKLFVISIPINVAELLGLIHPGKSRWNDNYTMLFGLIGVLLPVLGFALLLFSLNAFAGFAYIVTCWVAIRRMKSIA